MTMKIYAKGIAKVSELLIVAKLQKQITCPKSLSTVYVNWWHSCEICEVLRTYVLNLPRAYVHRLLNAFAAFLLLYIASDVFSA